MQDTPFETTLLISQLLLDTQNPRLPEIQESQHDAIRTMAKAQGSRILALAQHMVEYGPNLASRLIVMPSDDEDEKGMYYVLDGNRRLAALKLLEAPSLAEGIFDASSLRKLKRLAAEFETDPIVKLGCVVYANREEADPWIQLIHRGQNQGAGLVEWDGQVAARYDARKGSKSVALQVLDYVKEHGNLSNETRQRIDDGRFPITTLERLLNTPYVRKKLGVEKENGTIVTSYPEDEVVKGLSRVVEDLGSGQVTVSKLKSQDQRIDYINGLKKDELPDPSKALTKTYHLGQQPSSPISETNNAAAQIRKTQSRYRTTLIPRECKLNIGHHRINKVYSELKRLDLDDFPNAGAVMLRVFIELSLDYYLEHKVGWPEPQIQNSSLAQKLNGAATYLENHSIMTTSELAPIRKAAGGQTLLAASIKTMHGYVHSRYFSPVASELKTAWDDFQQFMESIWSI